MKYIVENWFVIVGLIAVCAAGGYVVYIGIRCYVKDWREERGYY